MPLLSEKLREEAYFRYKRNAGKGMCWVQYCQNHSRHDSALCHKHVMQRWRGRRKRTATYNTLKNHAKERKIPFTINPDYWQGLTDGFNFFEETEDVMTIDRVDPCKGYEPGNLRVVSVSVNVIKGNRERYLPEHVQEMMRRNRETAREELSQHLEDEEDPF